MRLGRFLTLLSLCTIIRAYLLDWPAPFQWPEPPTLLAVLRQLDPRFLPNDFLTNSISRSPNAVFAWLVAGFCRISGLNWIRGYQLLKLVVAALQIPMLYLVVAVILPISRKPAFQLVFFFFAILSLNNYFTIFYPIAQYSPFQTWLVPYTVAMAMFPIGLGLWKSRSACGKVAGIGILAAAELVHPVVGLCYCSFALLLEATVPGDQHRLNRWSTWVPMAACLSAGVTAIKIFSHGHIGLDDLMPIYVLERHPHHFYMPFILKTYGIQLLLTFLALVIPTLLAKKRGDAVLFRQGLLFSLAFMAFQLGQYLFANVWPVRYVVLFGLTRFYLFSFWMIAILWSALATTALPSPEKVLRWFDSRKAGLILAPLFCLLFAASLVVEQKRARTIDKGDRQLVHWLRDHTTSDAVIGIARNGDHEIQKAVASFFARAFAKRAVTGDLGFPFEESTIVEWSQRWRELFVKDGVFIKTTTNRVDYVLVDRSVPVRCDPAFKGRHFNLYLLEKCPGACALPEPISAVPTAVLQVDDFLDSKL
jgi:hypothetical protein